MTVIPFLINDCVIYELDDIIYTNKTSLEYMIR